MIGGTTDLTQSKLLVAVGTAVVAGVMSILMGLVANFPIALAAGLGINGLITGMVITHASDGVTFADLMGLVVIEGVIILVLVLTGFRKAVFRAIPTPLKVAISVGIGLFIAYIGVIDAGFARRPTSPGLGPERARHRRQPQRLADARLRRRRLPHRRAADPQGQGRDPHRHRRRDRARDGHRGGLQASARAIYDRQGALHQPRHLAADRARAARARSRTPRTSASSASSACSARSRSSASSPRSLFVFSLLLADFFDTMGTVVAIGTEAKLLDEDGNPPHTDRILVVDSVAAIAGGAGGVSSNTTYIESASGVEEGARTGLASVVTGVLFLLATFLAPLFAVVPSEAAAPALVIVGFLMMTQVTNIDWDDMEVALPAFLTIVLMPFTYNITVGIGAGFIAWVLVKIAKGHARPDPPAAVDRHRRSSSSTSSRRRSSRCSP